MAPPAAAMAARQAHGLLAQMMGSTRAEDFAPQALLGALRQLSDACTAAVPAEGLPAPTPAPDPGSASQAARRAEAAEQKAQRLAEDNEELHRQLAQLDASARSVSDAAAEEVQFWMRAAAERQGPAERTAAGVRAELEAAQLGSRQLDAELREVRAQAVGAQQRLEAQVESLRRQQGADRESRESLEARLADERQAMEQESARSADARRTADACERELAALRLEAQGLRAELLRREDEQAQLEALLRKHEELARSFGAVPTLSAAVQGGDEGRAGASGGELKLKDAEIEGLAAKARVAEVQALEMRAKLEEVGRHQAAADQQAELWKDCAERQQARLQASATEAAEMSTELAQAQQESLALKEKLDAAALRSAEQADLSVELAQAQQEAVALRAQLDSNAARATAQAPAVAAEERPAEEDKTAEKDKTVEVIEQQGDEGKEQAMAQQRAAEDEVRHRLEAELARSEKGRADESDRAAEQIAALQAENDQLRNELSSRDSDADKAPPAMVVETPAPPEASEAPTASAAASEAAGGEAVKGGLALRRHMSAMRIQSAFRQFTLRRQLAEAVAGEAASAIGFLPSLVSTA